jgi:hypothetical protein
MQNQIYLNIYVINLNIYVKHFLNQSYDKKSFNFKYLELDFSIINLYYVPFGLIQEQLNFLGYEYVYGWDTHKKTRVSN